MAVAAAVLALAGKAAGMQPAAVPASAFGGSVPVHIAQVGHIDVDLEASSSAGLRRVRCLSASGRTACFVAPR